MIRLFVLVRPASGTPGEFADVQAARNPADVADLIEMVCYGSLESTSEREARAVETVRDRR